MFSKIKGKKIMFENNPFIKFWTVPRIIFYTGLILFGFLVGFISAKFLFVLFIYGIVETILNNG